MTSLFRPLIPKKKLVPMILTEQKNKEFGVANYRGRMDEMSSAVNCLSNIIRVEDYREELKRNVLNSLTLDKILERYSRDEIQAYLDKLTQMPQYSDKAKSD